MSTEYQQTPLSDELDAFFAQYTAANQSKALVYGLVGPAGLVHSAGFGSADDEGTTPDLNTVFPIASMSKSFTACAALLARDRGLINLDAPITDFFPEYTASGTFDDPCDPPTVRMLFSMSGGLTEDNSWVDPFIDAPVDDILARVADGLRYSSLPGTAYEYSNLGYALAGLAVGKAVGRPIEEWVHDEVIAPLGLASTWFDAYAPDRAYTKATAYSLDPDGAWVAYPPAASGAFASAGGIQSTVRDLATWVSWLGSAFRPPVEGDPNPVGRAARREMQRLHQVDLPTLALRPTGDWHVDVGGYALGLRITEDIYRGTIVSHGGGLPGYKLYMIWHPDSGHGIVVLTNSHRGDPVAMSHEALFRVLERHGTAARTVRLWPSTVELRQSAEQLIRNWDDELAAGIFAENVDFDRSIAARRAEIEQFVAEIGPLGPPRPLADITSAATPADITWAIPGERGELICMVHLTPVQPARIQEFEVKAVPYDRPRSVRPSDISQRRTGLGAASVSPLPNVRVLLPDS